MKRTRLRCRRHAPRRERGVAALLVTTLLCFAMILAIAYTQRSLLAEQRTSANLIRSAQAFEAAEAGLEWALALLNDNRRLGADCLPAADPAAASFRDRMLRSDAAGAAFVPITWNDAGTDLPLEAACVRTGAGWSCSCPTSGRPTLTVPAGPAATPAFRMRFAVSPRSGQVRAIATGCTSLAGACTESSAPADATARVEVAFGLLGSLRRAPAATLTVRGAVDADTSAWSAANADPAGTAIAVLAGGAVAARAARLSGAPGAPSTAAAVASDTTLAGVDDDAFFAAVFGMQPARWAVQPAVTPIACRSGCAAELTAAMAAGGANPLFDVRGDLDLDGPVTLGSALRPVVIVVHGAARLNGAVALHGVLHGDSITWSGGGGTLRGAALAGGDFRTDGTPDLFYDAGVLDRLATRTGTFARVAGSWRDF